ncbi:MAG: hypothetical protein GY820_14400 [Gammaproteobacteria bacterium]|nr:hypothetical protein [Gammaproteobacteria bacterium]
MAVAKNTSQQTFTEQCSLDITVDTSPVQQVSQFKHLGVTIISSDGTIDDQIGFRKPRVHITSSTAYGTTAISFTTPGIPLRE